MNIINHRLLFGLSLIVAPLLTADRPPNVLFILVDDLGVMDEQIDFVPGLVAPEKQRWLFPMVDILTAPQFNRQLVNINFGNRGQRVKGV